jgi:LPXTG-motif cell wall-anchored protein
MVDHSRVARTASSRATLRCVAGFATMLVALVGVCGVAAAQEVAPVVTIIGSVHADTGLPDCPDHPGGPVHSGRITVARTGATVESLSIVYDVSGPVEVAHGVAVFGVGATTTDIGVTPTVHGQTADIYVTLLDGPGYDLGDPASVKVEVVYAPVFPPVYCEQFAKTTTSSSTTVATTATTPTSTTVVAAAVSSSTTVVSAAATSLPRTGASDSSALAVFALSLIGAGLVMIHSRRRVNDPMSDPARSLRAPIGRWRRAPRASDLPPEAESLACDSASPTTSAGPSL